MEVDGLNSNVLTRSNLDKGMPNEFKGLWTCPTPVSNKIGKGHAIAQIQTTRSSKIETWILKCPIVTHLINFILKWTEGGATVVFIITIL